MTDSIRLRTGRVMVRAVALLLAVLIVAIDQMSKQGALHALQVEGTTLRLPGPVDLTLVFNRSNAFGLVPVSGAVTRWGLAALNLGVAAALGWVMLRRPMTRPGLLGLACILAGAIGNGLDRLRYGWVIDFLNAGKLGFGWVFNVADASLDVGIGLILLGSLLARSR